MDTVNFVKNEGFKVLTPDGYKDFAGIAYMGDKPIYRVDFGNRTHLECTDNHKLFKTNGEKSELKDLNIGDWIRCRFGKKTKIKSIIDTGRVEPVYDLIEVDGGHRYYTNSVLSSNCEFITDDETLIHPMALSRLKSLPPIQFTGTTRWYQVPEPNKAYLVALDPSLGTEGDYSCIQIFQMPEMIQVGEWQHNGTAPRGQVRVLMQTLVYIDAVLREHDDQISEPEIYWTFENNSIGEAILQILEDTGEERFPGILVNERKRKGQTRRFRKGMTTTNKNKLSACARFKSLIESDRMIVKSANLIKELKNYVAAGASFKAKSGEHDDLVSGCLLAVRMLDVALLWTSMGTELKEHISDDEIMDGESGYDDDPMPVVI